jgi:hypothetical protein
MGRVEPVPHVIVYVIPAGAIVLIRCNLLRYKASLLMPGQVAVQDPSAGCSGDNLKGRERFLCSRGQYGEGSQKSKEFGRFPSGALEFRIGQVGY